jgi:nucleotide-binding universal stress UspA family protein
MPTMQLRSIVCGVDFSRASRAALRAAAALTRSNRGRLTVVFVDDPLLVAAARAAHDPRGGTAPALDALNRFTCESQRGKSRRKVQTRVAVGNPATEVLKAARRMGADLIVLGTHGSGRGTRLLFGSTLTQVLRKTRVPVLVVPSASRE